MSRAMPPIPRAFPTTAPTSRPQTQVECNVEAVDQMMDVLRSVLRQNETMRVRIGTLHAQQQLLRQTGQFERDVLVGLVSELHAVQQECNEIKQQLKWSKLQAIAELNGAIEEQDIELQKLVEENFKYDQEIGKLTADRLIAEEQLSFAEAGAHSPQRVEEVKPAQGEEEPMNYRYSVLTNNKLFEVLTTVPSDERAAEFLRDNAAETRASLRQLRALGEYILPEIGDKPTL